MVDAGKAIKILDKLNRQSKRRNKEYSILLSVAEEEALSLLLKSFILRIDNIEKTISDTLKHSSTMEDEESTWMTKLIMDELLLEACEKGELS